MHVQAWHVGAISPVHSPMDAGDVSRHLLADWRPNLPQGMAAGFLGWPQFLTTTFPFQGTELLALHPAVGATERQWKMVTSWMFGIAGARHFLEQDGYTWVAPLSAFYPELQQHVDVLWPNHLTALIAIEAPGNTSPLRPDYVALRPQGGAYDWALVEAKGTGSSLASMAVCKDAWINQVRAVVLELNGVAQPVSRHIVVATRSNPNAVTDRGRRLQIRAWNAATEQMPSSTEAAVDVVAACLFGVCANLGLSNNAEAIAAAVAARSKKTRTLLAREPASLPTLQNSSEQELERYGASRSVNGLEWGDVHMPLRAPGVETEVDIPSPLVSLIRAFGRDEAPEKAYSALQRAEHDLQLRKRQPKRQENREAPLYGPYGIELRVKKR
jgi:hypothetical protein